VKKWTIVVTAAAVAAAAGLGVGVAVQGSAAHPAAPAPPSAAPSRYPTASAQYAQAVDAAAKDGLRVWIETDLVKRWRAGPASFDEGIGMTADLARHPGVVGIKIADELGYHDGLDSPDKIRAFLTAAGKALHQAAPGRTILVDMIVPELGCLPGYQPPLRWATICAAQARGQYPQLALDKVDGYLRDHLVDAVDLSTGLLGDKTYSGWGVDQQTAQRTAWQEVLRRGWDKDVRLQARKALAHPGTYSATDTDQSATTFLDIPLQQGAAAVDVWTWRQLYQGEIYRLMDPGLRTNALWEALLRRRAHGAVLFTHLSPKSLEVDLDTDLKVLSTVFTDLFVAAGTG
jgi:hypothetical protein